MTPLTIVTNLIGRRVVQVYGRTIEGEIVAVLGHDGYLSILVADSTGSMCHCSLQDVKIDPGDTAVSRKPTSVELSTALLEWVQGLDAWPEDASEAVHLIEQGIDPRGKEPE